MTANDKNLIINFLQKSTAHANAQSEIRDSGQAGWLQNRTNFTSLLATLRFNN